MPRNTYTNRNQAYSQSIFRGDSVGSTRHRVNYLPKNKLPAFERLFEAIKAHCGSEIAACEFIGISTGAAWRLRVEKKLSSNLGMRIVEAYKTLQANGTGTNASADTGSRSQAGI